MTMTIKDLKEFLRNLPDDMEVHCIQDEVFRNGDQIPMSEARLGDFMRHPDDTRTIINVGSERHDETYTFWREVKETDIPLTKEEPYLKLSVNDCKSLLSTNDNYAAYHKVQEFIKDK